ncbi:MAG: serine protease [Verrucomicrobiales bacterium]|nr:serine protease [Verrucomicrobiales bacterium]
MKNIATAVLIFLATFFSAGAQESDFSNIESHIKSHAESMADACVSIKAENGAWGSGVIVSRTGMIFSAAHVYGRLGETVTVFFNEGVTVSATVVKYDKEHDIAVLKLARNLPVVPAKVERGDRIENGKTLIAAGHASGFNAERRSPLRVGFGFLAQRRGMIYTTCRITAGDSGGPLYDEAGILRGVHHTMDVKGKFSAHVPVQRFFQLWPELAKMVATV